MDEATVPDPVLMEEAGQRLAGARRVVALTGAGISTEAGIPDFRGPDGVFRRDPDAERRATLEYYLADEEVRRRAWRGRLDSPLWRAQPTAGHRALVELERRGRLDTVVTQNVDGLHQRAGSTPDRVVEVHGNSHWTACWSCGDRQPTLTVLERVAKGDDDPRCERGLGDGPGACGGILKTATISFGQSLEPDVLERARRAALRADVLLAIGTTLEVQPVAGVVPLARRSGALVVIVNGGPTALDHLADVVLRGRIGAVLPALVGATPG